MSDTPASLQPLMAALARHDEETRAARADRITWASAKSTLPSAFIGGLVPLRLMEEARVCYVLGRYMSTVLCALAFVEHTLAEELDAHLVKRPRGTFAEAIRLAKEEHLAPLETLNRVDKLRQFRNTYAHWEADVGDHSLYERFRSAGKHPDAVLEQDAQAAIEVMYECLSATLRPGA